MRYAAFVLLGILAVGCNKKESAPSSAAQTTNATVPPTTAAPASNTSGMAGAAPWLAVPSATATILPNMGMAERFQTEAQARPKAKPAVEDAFAALEAAGLKLADKKQHLAMTFGARYCVGTTATSGSSTLLQLSVCEYVSPELAASSATYSEESLRSLMPTRQVIAHKQLALMVRPENGSPESAAALEKAKSAFAKL